MKPIKISVYDPLSGYPFLIDSPFPLKTSRYAIHPIYLEPFDSLYKNAKQILLNNEESYNIQIKTLVLSAFLYNLSTYNIIKLNQFKTLRLSYGFFNNFELLADLFFIAPKLVFMDDELRRKKFPSYRITNQNLASIGLWLKRIKELINERDRYYQVNSYDEEFLRINAVYSKWKLYSKNSSKLPQKVIHYLHTICAFTPAQKKEWLIYFEKSAGELYLANKAKSEEAFNLFWQLLKLTDFIECNDYQNTLTFSIVKFLKKKIEEWVDWEPSFFGISVDYRLLAKKSEAWSNAKNEWTIEAAEHKAQRADRMALSKSALDRIREIRNRRETGKELEKEIESIKPKFQIEIEEKKIDIGFEIKGNRNEPL